jgi:chemotaxis protein CheD
LQDVTDARISVRMGEFKVGLGNSVLFAIGLGSCVGVALYDPRIRVGGLAHVMLPHPLSPRRPAPPGRFASTAVEHLIHEMEQAGAARRRLYARLVGGAAMFESVLNDESGLALGQRNIEASRLALQAAGVPIQAEEVGGNHGRTVHFHVADGRVVITSVRNPDVIL